MRSLVCAAVLVLGAAGCSASEGATLPGALPPVASTGAASPTASAPASTTAPLPSLPPVAKPAGADAVTPDGASLFARYWYDELNRAYDVMNGDALAKLSHRDCQTCRNYLADIKAAAEEGEQYSGGGVEVLTAEAPFLQGGTTVVLLTYSSDPLTVKDRAGALITSSPARSSVTSQVQVVRRGASWVVREIRDTA